MLPGMEHSPLGSTSGDQSILPNDATLAVVIRAHVPHDKNQMALNLHERVVVLERHETGWWGGHRLGEEFVGWFPGACVMEIRDPQIDQIHDEPVHDQEVQEQQNRLVQYAGWEEEQTSRGRLSSTVDTSDSSHNSKRLSAATSPQHAVSTGPDRRSLRPTVMPQNDTATLAALRATEAKAAQYFDELTRLQRQREAEKREADGTADEFRRVKAAIERRTHEETCEYEHHLQTERAEKQRLLSETETLRNHLERERRKCQAHKEEMERCRDSYSRQLKEKDELIQSSRKSFRLAEERAKVLKEELQVMTSQRSIENSEVLGSVDQPVRRLFSSTGSNQEHDQSAGERSLSPPSGLPFTATQTSSSAAADRPQAPVNTDTPRAATVSASTYGVARIASQTQVSNTNHPMSSLPPPLLPTSGGSHSGTQSATQFGAAHQARTRMTPSTVMLPAAAVGRSESVRVSRFRGRQAEEIATYSQLQQNRRAGSQGPAAIGNGDERPTSGSVFNRIREIEKRAGTPRCASRDDSSTSLDSPAALRSQVSNPPPYAMSFAADQRDSQPPVASRSQQHSHSGQIPQAPVRGMNMSPLRGRPNSSRTCLTSAFMSAPAGGSIPVAPGSQEGRNKAVVKPAPLVIDDISRQDSSLVSPGEKGENTPISVRDRVRFFAKK
eukprot:TRINITY_DN2700_c0_g1_i2.p1 TRINITY_DN2700_c0_g1~~TRINITY_DN2700_c0_g1_i2.p1  ORF type:complete len:668 (+),score=61.74 TRINITY_DN2700_c0_g1_i2:56-2059(+)